MTPERSQKLEELFAAAIDLSPDAQIVFLDEQCANDPALRQELELLLIHDESQPDGFLHSPVGEALEHLHGIQAGTVIDGKYTLIRVLGEGGMGVVYLASQDRPRRTVALKLIRPGVASRTLLRRFEHETQILGRLQHPGIAQIHDAGTAGDTRTPQPYFAMEYVRGLPLLKHVDEKALRTHERLELFVRICDAVHYAHEQGVIHRDLKPGNILVDEHGQPKVLDFGVARATDSDIQVTTMQTNVGQLLGTLPYMSPEQVSGASSEIDARSDVYALGVLCYQLLTGDLPYNLRDKSVPEAARIICDHDPQTLASINRTLRGDVDTIVAKALQKEKERRYDSAAELAADVRRHLRSEPITARPPSTIYQLRKFAKRNKALVSSVCVVFVVLVAAVIVSVNYAIQATRARDLADAQAIEARRQAYLANIAAADSSLQLHDVQTARRRLEAVDASQRDTWEWQYLYSRLDDSLASFGADIDSTIHLTVLPDGRVVTTATDGRILIWDPYSGALVNQMQAHDGPVRAVASSPDGSIIASSGLDFSIRLQDAETGEALQVLTIPGRGVRSLQFSNDGQSLVSGGYDNAVRIWDVATGKQLHIMTDHSEVVNSARFTPDGSRIVTASGDQTLRVWDTDSGQCLHVLAGHTNKVWSADISPDGSRIASGSIDGTLRLWNMETAQVERVISGHAGEVLAVAFSTDGRYIATGSTDMTVRIWDGQSGQQLALLRGHHGIVNEVVWSGDDRFIATAPGGITGSVRIWDTAVLEGVNEMPVERWAWSLTFSPDGSQFVNASVRGTVMVWDAATGQRITELTGHTGGVVAAAWSPDGSTIASGGVDDAVRLWDAATGQPLASMIGHEGDVLCLQYSPDGTLLASGSRDRTIRLWDISSQREVAMLRGHTEELTDLAFSPDGSRLASVGHDYPVRLWNVSTGESIAVMNGHTYFVMDVEFSPDGSILVSASSDSTVRFWDPVTGEALDRILEHPERVLQVEFTPDGRRLLTGSGDGTVRLWDSATLEEVLALRKYTTVVHSLAISPDAVRILAAAGQTNLYQWEALPVTDRIAARRRRAELMEDLRPLVEELFEELDSADAVVAALQADAALDESQRRVALQLALSIAVAARAKQVDGRKEDQ